MSLISAFEIGVWNAWWFMIVFPLQWLFFLATIITFSLLRDQAAKEESHCCEKFGLAYQEYMGRTARWIGMPKLGS